MDLMDRWSVDVPANDGETVYPLLLGNASETNEGWLRC